MNATVKYILTFIAGVVVGIAGLLLVGIAVTNTPSSNNYTQFEQPKTLNIAKHFKVIQVLPDGNALAMSNDYGLSRGFAQDMENLSSYGTVVLLLASDDESYYDDQQITISSTQCLRQVGTYRYATARNVEKTVPVVEIDDK